MLVLLPHFPWAVCHFDVTACANAHRLEKSSTEIFSILGGAVVGAVVGGVVGAVVGTAVGLAPHAEGAVVVVVVAAVVGRPTRLFIFGFLF